jgi:hypothetical protein
MAPDITSSARRLPPHITVDARAQSGHERPFALYPCAPAGLEAVPDWTTVLTNYLVTALARAVTIVLYYSIMFKILTSPYYNETR